MKLTETFLIGMNSDAIFANSIIQSFDGVLWWDILIFLQTYFHKQRLKKYPIRILRIPSVPQNSVRKINLDSKLSLNTSHYPDLQRLVVLWNHPDISKGLSISTMNFGYWFLIFFDIQFQTLRNFKCLQLKKKCRRRSDSNL